MKLASGPTVEQLPSAVWPWSQFPFDLGLILHSRDCLFFFNCLLI